MSDVLPTEDLERVMWYLPHRDIINMAKSLNIDLSRRSFWLNVLRVNGQDDWELEWIETMDAQQLQRLLIKWETDAASSSISGLGYSPGSERCVDNTRKMMTKVYLDDNLPMIEHISKLFYDPIAYASALAQRGDRLCIEVLRENEPIRHSIIWEVTEHIIIGGHTELFIEAYRLFKELYGDDSVTDLDRYAIKYNRLDIFKMIYDPDKSHLNGEIVKKIVENGENWVKLVEPTFSLLVASDDIQGVKDHIRKRRREMRRRPYAFDANRLYIKSTEMIDTLHDLGAIHNIYIWISLFSALDGTQQRLDLLKHYDSMYEVQGLQLQDMIHREVIDVPQALTQQVIQYVMSMKSIPMKMKREVLLCGYITNIKDLARIISGATDIEIFSLIQTYITEAVFPRYNTSDRYKAPYVMYLGSLCRDLMSGYDLSKLGNISSIELLGVIVSFTERDFNDVCTDVLGRYEEMGYPDALIRNVVRYFYFILGETTLHPNMINYCKSDVNTALTMMDLVETYPLISTYKDNGEIEDIQILLGLAVSKGEIDRTNLSEYLSGSE